MKEWLDRCHFGDCIDVLRQMPDGIVQTCVTSPPYFGLRDYGTGEWIGGAEDCAHSVGQQVSDSKAPGAIITGIRPGTDGRLCRLCGARREDAQIGLEPTPGEYVDKLVEVFREVRRVLRDDGTLWLNLGDSYARNPGKGGSGPGGKNIAYSDTYGLAQVSKVGSSDGAVGRADRPGTRAKGDGLKEKDLIGIPWRVAFALQADGWYLRQDIIWHKPNPMPESVEDRCTKSHEYFFLLSKSATYFCDMEAVKEPAIYAPGATAEIEREPGYYGGKGTDASRNDANFKAIRATRNKRSVWTVATSPYEGAHFATFPPKLIEPCILAGAPLGGVVLDPFFGSGTTGQVAQNLGRHYIGCELNPGYELLQRERLRQPGLFLECARD